MILRTITRNLLRANRTTFSKPIDYAVCIDIECTCDSPLQIQPMEVIEIACLKLDLRGQNFELDQETNARCERSRTASRTQQSTHGHKRPRKTTHLEECPSFHSFVKPVINPELTLFCQELTGIMQSTVDRSDTLEKVIDNLFNWLREEGLINMQNNHEENFAFASCGNFDLNLLSPIVRQYKFSGNIELPIYFREWVNVKKTFVNHKKEWPKGLYHMLEILGEQPSGRLHSAIDDCKNLARIVECLHSEGCKFHITNRVS